NILISSLDPAVIKVSDFGLATVQESRHAARTVCGTPFYMAPEVCVRNERLRRYDCKADSWSVGMTLLHT
ncbi:kinase-like domain-containing protein, partial [Irpex rosettiformis]